MKGSKERQKVGMRGRNKDRGKERMKQRKREGQDRRKKEENQVRGTLDRAVQHNLIDSEKWSKHER